tara:strand:+ start:1747 stop:2139 length:393 start_codon:yes stop_codon:yes gene_type:complete
MTNKNLNKIAAIEKAISEKYGDEAIQNPHTNWSEEKEKMYLEQLGVFYSKSRKSDAWEEKIDIDGVKVSKKLLSRESLANCPVCGNLPKKSLDDVCLVKFECCSYCYYKYVEDREKRWSTGWRPEIKKDK